MAKHHKPTRTLAPHPLTEGHIGLIFQKFIQPLTRYKPEGMDLKHWWDWLFHVEERTITRYLVTKGFQMPGLLCPAPLMKVQGIGFRRVKAGDTLWVRTDSVVPDQVDIEWHGAGRQQIFCLNSTEWGAVKLNLEEAECKRGPRK